MIPVKGRHVPWQRALGHSAPAPDDHVPIGARKSAAFKSAAELHRDSRLTGLRVSVTKVGSKWFVLANTDVPVKDWNINSPEEISISARP